MRKTTAIQRRLVTTLPGDMDCVPSRHDSLPFADAVARMLHLGADHQGQAYRRVWLELPRDISGLPTLIAARLPACGGMVITWPSRAPITRLSAPVYDSEGRVFAREGEEVHSGGMVPCTPTDSICAAAWVSHRLLPASRRPELTSGDVSSRVRFEMAPESLERPNFDCGKNDPSRFQMGGLSIDRFWSSLEWPVLCRYDQVRDENLAWEFSQTPEGKHPALAIIGAAHADGIRRHLGEGTGRLASQPDAGDEGKPRLDFVPLSPDLMHRLGLMDLPFVADLFADYLLKMTPTSASDRGFDYPMALDRLIEEAIRRHGPMSPRSLATFRRMLNETLTLKGSWMVENISELSALGEACVSRTFGAALGETAARSSRLLNTTDPANPKGLLVAMFNGLLCRLEDGKLCAVPLPASPPNQMGRKAKIPGEHIGQLGIPEKEREKKCSRWSGLPARSENLHRKRTNFQVRRVAHRLLQNEENQKNRKCDSVSYRGSLAMGIDIRGTIRDRSRGNPRALRVWKPRRDEAPSFPCCHNQCPIVYVFDPELATSGKPPVGHQSGNFVFKDDSVTVAAYWYKDAGKRPHPGITVREMSVYANLFATEEHEYDEVKCREWIEANIPPHCRCRRAPWYDNDLAAFQGDMLSQALAWAVRYSLHHFGIQPRAIWPCGSKPCCAARPIRGTPFRAKASRTAGSFNCSRKTIGRNSKSRRRRRRGMATSSLVSRPKLFCGWT